MEIPLTLEERINTKGLRPYQRLPMPAPSEGIDPGPVWFHDNFASAFIPDMIKMMSTGLNIDRRAVEKLRGTINTVLKDVTKKLNRNPIVKQYQELRALELQKKHKEKVTASVRTLSYYIKEYNSKDITHRTWVVNYFLKSHSDPSKVKDKWTMKCIKDVQVWLQEPFLQHILDKKDISKYVYVKEGMKELAQYKLDLFNRPRYVKAEQAVDVPEFNPASSVQKQELFEMLKIEPLATSKTTGNSSWGRSAIEELQKITTDENLLKVLQALVDFSYSGIIKSNFLASFDSYTIDGVLHGNVKLFGAKSFRLTSNSPNLLNAPSTGSIYAKPLKRCFIAPEGFLIYAIDYAALEDRVIANLSKDSNKLKVFTDGLDGHSLAAVFYNPEGAREIIGEFDNEINASKKLKSLVDAGNTKAADFRQFYKRTSFGLAYGKFPDADKGGIITQEIFDNYHNKLYPGITDYRENYVLSTAKKQGYIHIGLGARVYTDDPDSHIRTLNNSTCQFWSILTLIAINELNYRIVENGFEDSIQVISTIYDSIYLNVIKDPETIKWLNDNLVSIMEVDYLENIIVKNEAVGEISDSWTDMIRIPNNSTIKEIEESMKVIRDR